MAKALCPECSSEEIEVDIFDDNKNGKHTYTRVWRLRCRDCGFDKTQAHPFFWKIIKNNLI